MRMRGSATRMRSSMGLLVLTGIACFGQHIAFAASTLGQAPPGKASAASKKPTCARALLQGDVKAGESFDVEFTKGLRFYLEPLASGWIVRVLAARQPRGPHDYAELATPPYQSVSPLLLSTDWSFRAQDAVGWNPRHFRYARDTTAFNALAALYPGVMADDAGSAAKVAQLVSVQPEGVLEILDARIAPGIADQSHMAAAVALHFAETPHSVDSGSGASPLGRLEELRFRVRLDLPPGLRALRGVTEEPVICPARPTATIFEASQKGSKQSSRR